MRQPTLESLRSQHRFEATSSSGSIAPNNHLLRGSEAMPSPPLADCRYAPALPSPSCSSATPCSPPRLFSRCSVPLALISCGSLLSLRCCCAELCVARSRGRTVQKLRGFYVTKPNLNLVLAVRAVWPTVTHRIAKSVTTSLALHGWIVRAPKQD